MSATATATRTERRRKAYHKEDWAALHKSTGKLDFTPVFNPAIEEYLRMAKLSSLAARLLTLLQNQSWGNQKKFAVLDDSRTTPFYQADAARALRVSTGRINEASKELQERYLLRIEGKLLYPVADPAAARAAAESEFAPNVQSIYSPSLRLALEVFFQHNPQRFDEFSKALTILQEIKKEARRYRREHPDLFGRPAETDPAEEGRSEQNVAERPSEMLATSRAKSAPNIIEIGILQMDPVSVSEWRSEPEVDHSLTHAPGDPEPETPEPENAPEQEPDPVVAVVEQHFGAFPAGDPVRGQLSALADEYRIDRPRVIDAIVRQLDRPYEIHSRGALLQFVRSDLERYRRAAAPTRERPESPVPASERDLVAEIRQAETLAAMFYEEPHGRDQAERLRRRAEELRREQERET